MNFTAHRTCTVVRDSQSPIRSRAASVPLAEFVKEKAYVLIGEPGAGKTTALQAEMEAHGGVYVSVHDFLTYDDKPEWHGTTLYLDGLDEVRAGEVDRRPPLDRILAKLDRLECPPFRLSCRWADWLGAYDRSRLDGVAGGALAVLRLDPLSIQDIKRILAENHGIADPGGFISGARKRGVGGLLTNPQNLDLLAKAVSGGNWPGSRLETFESACQMLVTEPNIEHSVISYTAGEAEQLLDGAGRLCALQILGGLAGFTQQAHVPASRDYPRVPADSSGVGTSPVLRTRLFAGTSEGRLIPAHRQIAEFLAARHVSGLINGGLPIQRVLALVTGFDGELIRPFRNFAAWLGVHNRPSRKQLCRLNPVGLFHAGGEARFSTEERRDVLSSLRREADWNPDCIYTRRRLGLGPLVSPELQDAFHEILSAPETGYPNEPYVMMALQALGDGEPLPALVAEVVHIVRDPSWLPGVRCAALDILIAYRKRDVVQTDVLLGLLDDIEAGKLDDPDDDLLGLLLKALYPGDIPVSRALKHLRTPKRGLVGEQFVYFWAKHVPAESTDAERTEFLDAIAADFGSFRSVMIGGSYVHSIMGELPAELLRFRLRGSNDDIPIERLWGWLLVASGPGLRVLDSTVGAIGVELERSDARLKELITFAVDRCVLAEDAVSCVRSMESALFRARPRGLGRWCVDRALSATTELAAAIYIYLYVDHVIDPRVDHFLGGPNAADLTLQQFRERLNPKPSLVARFDERLGPLDHPPDLQAYFFFADLLPDTKAQAAFQGEIEAESEQLQAGDGSPCLLEKAAQAYFGNAADTPGESPGDRVGRLVGSRTDLAAHLRTGLLGVLCRDDLPSPSDVAEGCVRGEMPPLAFPLMAALHELDWPRRLDASGMSDGVIGLAVTILHSVPEDRLTPDPHDPFRTFPPNWLSQLLQDRPRPVADALVRAIRQKMAMGVVPASEVRVLVRQDHRDVAALVCQPLLRTFPGESGTVFLEALGWLLAAALKSCDGDQLERTIQHRLRDRKLPEAQRPYWVAAGFLLAPGRYSRELQGFANEPDRLRALLDFQCRIGIPYEGAHRFEASELRLLIALTGVAMKGVESTEPRREVMSGLIQRLSPLLTQEAADILQELKQNPDFAPWALDISLALGEQSARRRARDFQLCGIDQVANTLENGRPAHAGDLAALVVAEIGMLADEIRDGSASFWRHFWNVDEYNRATDPRHEESCRDAILFALQRRLARLGIDAQPEGTYADDKRSDIRVAHGGFNVPIEIKRSCHPDLWTAIPNQLVQNYTRDPGATGFGIYLVLWFGPDTPCKPTALKGWVPEDAGGLESQLANKVPSSERSRISVCVIDVSNSEKWRHLVPPSVVP